jgi:hypothetical protein
MPNRTWAAALVMGMFALSLHALPLSTSYTGTFAQDDDERIFYFTISAASTITLRTYSYAGGVNAAGTTIPAGGFDPVLSVFDSAGNLIGSNEDGGCTNADTDPTTSLCWDSFLRLPLPAGNYSVVLTQSANLANGPTLADSFVYAGAGNFTPAPAGQTPGFWDESPSKRNGNYAVDIVGTAETEITTITSSATPPRGVTARSYGPFAFTATSGPGIALTWSIASGSLPAGLSLDGSTGAVSGTPSAAGIYPFTIQVTDGIHAVAQAETISVFNPVLISTSNLPSGQAGQSYGPVSLAATGGSGSYSWSATGLPSGLTIAATGQINGTPSGGGTFSVQLSAVDGAASLEAHATLSLNIGVANLQITSAGALGEFVPFTNVAGTLTASGGKPPYMWSASGLPSGFHLNATTGAFSGAAPGPGVYSFNAVVTDSQSPALTTTMPVNFSVLGITTAGLPSASTSSPYQVTLAATGGTPPYHYSASGLPGGLALSSAGVLSGTPTAAGNFGVALQVTDAINLASASVFNLVVSGGSSPLTAPGGVLTSGTVSSAYSAALQASGGKPPYTWGFTGGALPPGVSLASSGVILGTPKVPGTFQFGALVTDSAGASVSATFSIAIEAPALTLSSLSTFPAGMAGQDYPLQILTAGGGTPPYQFAITNGTLPGGLTFSSPQFDGIPTTAGTFTFTVTVTDAAQRMASAQGSILIQPAHADLLISQSTVQFSLAVGSGGLPSPASVTVRSSDIQQLLHYSVDVSPTAPWLVVAGGGTTPDDIKISISSSALSLAAADAYQATINVTCVAPSPCAGTSQKIAVSLRVSAPAPQLTFTTNLLQFHTAGASAGPIAQPLGIQNTGGGTLDIQSIAGADNWLTISDAPNELLPGPAAALHVTANPAGLKAGYYVSSIVVDSSAATQTLPVSLYVASAPTMLLAPQGSQYEAPAGSTPGNNTGSFRVSVAGDGPVNWTASATQGAAWLHLAVPNGVSTSSAPAAVQFSIDANAASALSPGTYYGSIRITSPDVSNSPLDYGVVLNITPTAKPIKPILSPAGLVFTSLAGTTPQAQSVQIFASAATAVPYQASAATADGANWLSVSPATGSTSAGSPAQSAVSADISGLAPGIYHGGVSYAFSSSSVRTVSVTLIVRAESTGSATVLTDSVRCTASTLAPTQIALPDNFQQQVGWPAPLQLFVVDDCGAPVASAQVHVTFSNGDPPIVLDSVDNSSGIYSGTWTPYGVSPQVTVNADVSASGLTSASSEITGEASSNTAPILAPNGALDVFNAQLGGALAPGSIVQIYGSNLSQQTAAAVSVPLSTALGGSSVLIGGIAAPLYYVSPGQINAQVPFELAAGGQYQLQVNSAGALTTPQTINLTSMAPGVAAFPYTGSVIAQHLDYSLVTEEFTCSWY